jgi:hypothetical protein
VTEQEMFDRAVRGLAAQNWRRCVDDNNNCVYLNEEGERCAWGHVDPSLKNISGTVLHLNKEGIGLAATLTASQLRFATELQQAHDSSISGTGMEDRLRRLAKQYSLVWPEGC